MTVNAPSAFDPIAAVPSAVSAPSSSEATEQRFLKLLVTQLNNQDPLNPMDNAQLTSQLAQMSTVSGIERMNGTLETLLAQSNSGQMLQAASLVNRAVLVPGDRIAVGEGSSAFALDLPASAGSVKAVITNAAGTPVRTIDLGALPAGLHLQPWSGEDDAGQALAAGQYRLQVMAANGSAPVAAASLVIGTVAGVSQDPGRGISLDLANGQSVSLADVRMLR